MFFLSLRFSVKNSMVKGRTGQTWVIGDERLDRAGSLTSMKEQRLFIDPRLK